jgi:hypothetical protein
MRPSVVLLAVAAVVAGWVTTPSVPPGRYPIEVLSGSGKSRSSFAPVIFRVTAG